MRKDDRIRLQHMRDAANDIVASAVGRTRADLDGDLMWARGIVKSVEIIGEAASHVALDTRAKYPQIPWVGIVGMRNRLVHVYYNIDLEQVWLTVAKDAPELAAELERILAGE